MGTEKESEPPSQVVQWRIQIPVLKDSHLHAAFSIFAILHTNGPPLTAGPHGVFVRIRKSTPSSQWVLQSYTRACGLVSSSQAIYQPQFANISLSWAPMQLSVYLYTMALLLVFDTFL